MAKYEDQEATPIENGLGWFPLPPGAIALVTPWLVGANDQYVGMPADPRLLQVTALAEIAGEVPIMTGCFLSWHSEMVLGDAPSSDAISSDHPASHQHDLVHDHSMELVGPGQNGITWLDDNDIGDATAYASVEHSHWLDLDPERINFGEEDRQQWFEPLHYEVSAWIVRDNGEPAAVPAGMLAFRDDGQESLPGWRRLDLKTLGKDPREPDRTYRANLWLEEAVKVVGCTPDKHQKGTRDHSHEIEPHSHSGQITSSSETNTADSDGGNTDVAKNSHTHAISQVASRAPSMTVAPNLRRHRKLTFWVAEEDGVEVPPGMLIPYVPQNRQVRHSLPFFGPDAWRTEYEASAKPEDPVFITSGRFVGGTDRINALDGENSHTHEVSHYHRVDIATTSDTRSREGDDNEIVAAAGHEHGPVFFEHSEDASSTFNPMRYRRVALIRKT